MLKIVKVFYAWVVFQYLPNKCRVIRASTWLSQCSKALLSSLNLIVTSIVSFVVSTLSFCNVHRYHLQVPVPGGVHFPKSWLFILTLTYSETRPKSVSNISTSTPYRAPGIVDNVPFMSGPFWGVVLSNFFWTIHHKHMYYES